MKANELMIGDWVVYRGDTEYTSPVRIEGMDILTLSLITEDREDVGFDGIEPIPITAEILEKNGWKDISTHTLKGCETYKLTYEQNGYDYTITVKLRDYFKLQSYDDRYYTLCEMDYGVKYVHELQHALRLCGIEKEIVL